MSFSQTDLSVGLADRFYLHANYGLTYGCTFALELLSSALETLGVTPAFLQNIEPAQMRRPSKKLAYSPRKIVLGLLK